MYIPTHPHPASLARVYIKRKWAAYVMHSNLNNSFTLHKTPRNYREPLRWDVISLCYAIAEVELVSSFCEWYGNGNGNGIEYKGGKGQKKYVKSVEGP